MPTGTNDFNQPLATDPTSPGQGIAQTGNRLLMGGGSNSATGRWLWASGFENGLAEWYPANGSQAIESATMGKVFQGKNSLLLTTGAVNNDAAGVSKSLFAQGRRYGIELMMRLPDTLATPGTTATEIIISMSGPSNTSGQLSIIQLVIKYDFLSTSAIYTRVNGVDTLISDLTNYLLLNQTGYFHYLKLVADTNETKFIRVFFDDLAFDLNDFPAYTIASTTKNLNFTISVVTKTNNVKTMLVDNVVITADEP